MSIHGPLVVALLVSTGWVILFSMSNAPGVRGYRNFGILAAYVCFVVFLFRASWRDVTLTWGVFAIAGGMSYTAWEVLQRLRTPKGVEKPPIGLTHLLPALVMWPVMMPEAIEYSLAELGVLKSDAKKH